MKRKSLPTPTILYFGEPGSFSHLAARKRYRTEKLHACPTVEQCFAQLFSGNASHIVVPVENASAGVITSTVDQLIALAQSKREGLAIRESLTMKIELALLAKSKRHPIRKIYSHLAPFNHASAWLKKHYPFAVQTIVESTSEAARRASGEPGSAAIGGVQAAQLYKLQVARKGVGAEVPNQTTFLTIGLEVKNTRRPTHTSLIFEVTHKPGALLAVLKALADERINLSKIESRPIPGRFSEYRFMIEFEVAPGTPRYIRAMRHIRAATRMAVVVGGYPALKI